MALAAVGLSCGSPGAVVAIEDLGDADLKVIITKSDQRQDITVLAAEAPFIYRQEPLIDVFDRGGTLRVIVIGMRSQDLRAAYPSLPDRPPAELAQALVPRLGSIGGGLYPPPPPTRVLTTTVEPDSPSPLEYQPTDLTTLGDEAAFGFALPGDVLCPPIGVRFRVFPRGNPALSCVYRRDANCSWAHQGTCPNEEAIYGVRLPVDRQILQLPDGRLLLPTGPRCEPIAIQQSPVFGETRAWRCGGLELGAQEPPTVDEIQRVPVGREDLRAATIFTPASLGAMVALGDRSFARLKMTQARFDLEKLVMLQVDAGNTNRVLEWVDPLHVRLNGAFSVDVRMEACLALGGNNTPIVAVSPDGGGAILTLGQPLPNFGTTPGWRVFGLPSQGTSAFPDLMLPSSNPTLRLTVGPSDRLVFSTGSAVYQAVTNSIQSRRNYYGCPIPVPNLPAGRPEVVVNGSGYLGLQNDALLLHGADGAILETIPLGGTLPADARPWRLTEESYAVASLGGTQVWRVDAQRRVTTHDLPGPLVALLLHQFAPSPRAEVHALYQSRDQAAELRLLSLESGNERRYLLPPFDESSDPQAARVRIGPEAVYDRNGRVGVAYGQGSHAGALDLLSGISVAFRLGEQATGKVSFVDDQGATAWAFASSATTAAVLRLP